MAKLGQLKSLNSKSGSGSDSKKDPVKKEAGITSSTNNSEATATSKSKSKSNSKVAAESLDSLLDDIEVDLGLSQVDVKSNRFMTSTGLLSLDLMLSGGMVTGGWYTTFGGEQSSKSTLVMNQMARAVNMPVPYLIYFDYEGSFSSEYFLAIARHNGVIDNDTPDDEAMHKIFGLKDDKNNWIVKPRIRYYPMSIGEKFFDLVAKLERSLPDKLFKGGKWWLVYDDTKENKKYKSQADEALLKKTGKYWVETTDGYPQAIIAVDSYPAMMPEKQDVDDPSQGLGAQARMFADNMKRIKGKMNAKRITVLGVNQLRLRPMVQFGCVHADVKIPFTDGSSHTIQEIVENKIKGTVWSMNRESGKLEPKAITAWHYNGEVDSKEDWLKITVRNPLSKTGFSNLVLTRDHKVFTKRGWIKAKKLKPSDLMLAKTTSMMSGKFGQFLAGSLSADATIVQDCKSMAYIRYQDNQNPEYLKWKLEKLSTSLSFSESTCGKNKKVFCSTRSPFFVSMKNKIGKRDPTVFKHTPLSLAILYMDDGYLNINNACVLSFKRFKNDRAKLHEIREIFRAVGVDGDFVYNEGAFRLTKESSNVLFELIRKYVPEPMQYKLPKEHQGFYKDFSIKAKPKVHEEFVEVTKVGVGTNNTFLKRGKYDISVADNKNYLAGSREGGVIISNSPEYEPCMIGSTSVVLANGKTETIENIVNNKLKVDVLSLDTRTLEVSTKPIVDWKSNGLKSADDLVTIVYRVGADLNRITCTRNHKVWTDQGWTEAENLVAGCSYVYLNGADNQLVVSLVDQVLFDQVQDQLVYDLTVADNHTYFVGSPNGQTDSFAFAVSNCGEALKFYSDTRIKMTSRSVQGGSGQIEEEEGINGGVDQYRYIHMRASKNKLSIPNLEGWARIWVKDAQGQAHGYDPVYDAHYFMKELGILSGTKNRIKIDLPKMAGHKPLSWMNFKRLILGDKATIKKVMQAHGIEKPFNLRKELFKLFEDGKAMEMYFAKKKADADGKSASEEDED